MIIKRVLVTGAGGFIGANLTRKLVEKGFEVGVLLRNKTKNWRLVDILNKLTLLEADLTDKDKVRKVVEGFKPEFIFHLAVYGSYPKFQKDVELMIKTNIIGTANLIDAAQGIPIINTGSSSEYGIKNSPMNEADICKPDNDYGWSKLSQTIYCQKRGIPTLRFFSVYGPWEEPTRLIPVMLNAKIKGQTLGLINSVRDYLYIDDVIEAFFKAAENYNDIKGEIINISSGQQVSMRDLIKIIDALNNCPLCIEWNFQAVQLEPSSWVADITKAKNLLRWDVKNSLEQGLRKNYEWVQKRKEINYEPTEMIIKNLQQTSEELRQKIIKMHKLNKKGHIGSSLSIVEILNTIYNKVLGEKDKFILSKGHASSALYVVLNDKGYLPEECIHNLEIHPKLNPKYKIEASTGTLGHGLSIGIGMALVNKEEKVFVLMGDGECDEGQVWEAARVASELKLNNLKVIIDCNGWQGFRSNDYKSLEDKFLAFGWQIKWCDGHNCEEIEKALVETHKKPLVILAKTIKGKGLPDVEGTLASHYFNF